MKRTPYLQPFQALFAGRETCYGQYGDGAEKQIRTVRGEASDEVWARHLQGEGPYLGMVPIRTDNNCYFGAIDIDLDTIDHQGVANDIKRLNLPLIVCKSKSGGAHLYVFFERPVPAPIVVKTLRSWSLALGFKENDDGRPIEIFPKQTALRPKDIGNWINLPYYGSDASTRKAVNAAGETLTLEQFIAVAEMLRVKDGTTMANLQPTGDDVFADGPPCLQTLNLKGFAEGSRNSGLYNVAIFFKLVYDNDWKAKLSVYNQENFAPPLSEREVDTIIFSIEKKDYSYNCDELPIQPHCQKSLCNKRLYGIAKLRSKHQVKQFPSMGKLRKILTDPPRWIVEIDGRDVELTTDNLTQLVSLKKVVFERLDLVLPLIKASDYDDILRTLLQTALSIEAPEDAGTHGQFIIITRQFFARRLTAETREDVLQGLPFEEYNRIYFRSSDLMSFLERKRFNKYTPAEIYSILRTMGATHQPLRTKKGIVKVWVMPVPDDEQTDNFDPVPEEKLGGSQF